MWFRSLESLLGLDYEPGVGILFSMIVDVCIQVILTHVEGIGFGEPAEFLKGVTIMKSENRF